MGPITSALAIDAAAIELVAALFASKAGLFVLGTLLGTSADTPLKRSARDTIAVDNFAMVEIDDDPLEVTKLKTDAMAARFFFYTKICNLLHPF